MDEAIRAALEAAVPGTLTEPEPVETDADLLADLRAGGLE